jgi:hypothetical protein
MQAPSAKNIKSFLQPLQIVNDNILENEKNQLITILTNYLKAPKTNGQSALTNLEKLSVSVSAISAKV